MANAPPLAEDSAPPAPAPLEDFESFYLRHRVRLFRALLVVTRDVHAAEELAQDSFVRVWERWDRVRRLSNPTGYLYRTAMNGWFQLHRRAARAARRMVHLGQAVDPMEAVEDRDLVTRKLLGLPPRQRAALVLTEYLGHDSAEAGRALGIRAGTVRRLASKARAALRAREEEETP